MINYIVMTSRLFTYHVVNIKRREYKTITKRMQRFTYHVVNIKPGNVVDEGATNDTNLHIT